METGNYIPGAIDLSPDQKKQKQLKELKDLQSEQIKEANGESEPDKIEANMNKKYKIKAIESEYVHVRLVTKTNNERSKTYDIIEKVDVYHKRPFDELVKSGAFNLFDEVEVIHHPDHKDYTAELLKPSQLNVDSKAPVDAKVITLKEKQLDKKEAELKKIAETMNEEMDRRNQEWTNVQKEMEAKSRELDRLLAEARQNANKAPQAASQASAANDATIAENTDAKQSKASTEASEKAGKK